jgi:hypothetical protein
MSKALTKEQMALLKEASEMFDETGCVPGFDGEQMPAEKMVPDVKEYISESIYDPEAICGPGDMGYAWVCASPFVAITKMAAKMSQARTSWE